MSEIAEQAVVTILMADFAMADPAGKANIVGAGLTAIGPQKSGASTVRFSVVVEVEVPFALLPQDFPLELALLDVEDQLVAMPSPQGAKPLRVAQVVSMERPQAAPGTSYPREYLRGRTRLILDFAGGLPLKAAQAYRWRVVLDGDESLEWDYPFAVVGRAQPPVIG